MRQHKLRLGFTLVELLVVIAIIAILAALLLPVMNSARVRSREAECTSNLHKISTALRAYAADFHAYPPAPVYVNVAPEHYEGGISALYASNYLDSKDAMICPADYDAQSHLDDAHNKLYSSYNGLVDFTTWKFQTSQFNGQPREQRLYNYWGYSFTPGSASGTWESKGFDQWVLPADNTGTVPWPSPTTGLPSWLQADGSWKFYPRLCNRYAPDHTIVTHCLYHRSFYGNANRAMDMVLRVGGEVQKVQSQPLEQPDSTGWAPWVHQR